MDFIKINFPRSAWLGQNIATHFSFYATRVTLKDDFYSELTTKLVHFLSRFHHWFVIIFYRPATMHKISENHQQKLYVIYFMDFLLILAGCTVQLPVNNVHHCSTTPKAELSTSKPSTYLCSNWNPVFDELIYNSTRFRIRPKFIKCVVCVKTALMTAWTHHVR